MVVVDTNVASELMKPSPDDSVRRWIRAQPTRELYTTAITLAEIRYGLERLPAGSRRDTLRATAEEVFATFEDQILAFDAAATGHYAAIVAGRDEAGRPIDGFDAQIASICRRHGAALATRNVKDFEHTGLELVDPWQPA